jgi:hypothetical protein
MHRPTSKTRKGAIRGAHTHLLELGNLLLGEGLNGVVGALGHGCKKDGKECAIGVSGDGFQKERVEFGFLNGRERSQTGGSF